MFAAIALSGCAVPPGQRAPVIDHSFSASASGGTTGGAVMPVQMERMRHEKDWRPEFYVVQKGDTLYSIAFNFGFDYHDLADLNGISDPTLIHVGQQVRLFPAAGASTATVQASPAKSVEIKDQPVVAKLPYFAQAVAQIEKMQAAQPRIEIKPQPAPIAVITEDGPVQWGMPASGKVVAGFSESDNRKGIDIAGKRGQPISASAAGKVVYSGSGLRGYGKLVIIKHNSTYLSAYAHNDKLLVKEGQIVGRGQKIAEMGSTDANRVELHFEIRKLGRPVDPAKYLPLPKS
jgi:lipoprotein NlpD